MDLKIKEEHKSYGKLGIRYKARLVSRVFSQIEDLYCFETFEPVVKFTSVRVFLSTVAINDLHLHQMDVITAFLNRELDEELYMEQPVVFEEGDPSRIFICLERHYTD